MSSSRIPAQPDRARASLLPALTIGNCLSVVLALSLVTALALSACSRRSKTSGSPGLSKRVVQLGQPVPKGGGRYKVGSPYKIGGRWYTPREDPSYNRAGVASWYGELFHGRYTANGEIFDMNALTAAHPTLPMPSYVRVTNMHNGRSLVLRVNDRGPYAHDRIIDLSRRSAQALGFERMGTAQVRVQYLGKAPLNGDDSLERRVYASQSWTRHASLAKKTKRNGSRTRLAQAVKQELRADPMVVGSVPKEDAASSRTRNWTTQGASVLPDERPGRPHYVQAASFMNREFANGLRSRLAGLGPVGVFPAEVSGQTWYRVRLGPYSARHDADEALRAVVGNGVSDARIVQN